MRRLLPLLLLSAVAACGTTVPLASQTSQSNQGLQGSQGVGPDGATLTGTSAEPGGAVQVPGAASASGSSSGNGSTNGAQGSLSGRPATGARGGGAAASTQQVSVGIIVAGNNSAAAGSFGFGSALSNGDERATAEAVVAHVNRTGGLAGHKLAAVYFTIDPNRSGSNTALEDEECAYFTQDHHVELVLTNFHMTPSLELIACLEKRGVTVVNPTAGFPVEPSILSKHPRLVLSGSPSFTLELQTLVRQLLASGFLTKASRVGILLYEAPGYEKAMNDGLVSPMQAAGLGSPLVARIAQMDNTSDLGSYSSAVAAAELRFASSNVDRVLFVTGGLSTIYFMNSASSQKYHPRYALTTNDGPAAVEALAPKDQFPGLEGIGWAPYFDLASPGAATTPGQRGCLALLKAAGVVPTGASATGIALGFCDELLLVQEAAKASGDVSADGVLRGFGLLGGSHASATSLGTTWTRGQQAPVRFLRLIGYDKGCTCLAYTSATRSF